MAPKPLRSKEEREAEFEAWCLKYPEFGAIEKAKRAKYRQEVKRPNPIDPEPDEKLVTRKQAEAILLEALKHSKPFRRKSY